MSEVTTKKRYFTTMDLLTMAVVAVAGAVFANYVWPMIMNVATPVFAFLGPVGWIGVSGIYVIFPVIVGLLIGKPGAVTIYAILQAFVEMLFGNPSGAMAMVYSGAEGVGVDLGMALFGKKSKLVGAMIGAGLGSLIVDEIYIFIFGMASTSTVLVGGITAFISGAILGGLVGYLITQALYKTGVVSKMGLKGYEEIE